MTAAKARAALAAHGVDLVNEHNGGRLLFRLFKEIPDAGRAYAHIQLHKVGAGNGEEAHAGLPGYRLGQQRLAGTRRAYQQHTLGDAGAQIDVFLRIFHELHDLLEFFLFLVRTGHIVKGNLPVLLAESPHLRGAELGHPIRPHATLRPHGHEVPHDAEQQRHHQVGQNDLQPVGGVRRRIAVRCDDPGGFLLLYQIVEITVKERIVMDPAAHRLLAVL